ncbi:MAG: hypothetical protein ACE5GJ_12180 [Gemmatimonadota bacterium]
MRSDRRLVAGALMAFTLLTYQPALAAPPSVPPSGDPSAAAVSVQDVRGGGDDKQIVAAIACAGCIGVTFWAMLSGGWTALLTLSLRKGTAVAALACVRACATAVQS